MGYGKSGKKSKQALIKEYDRLYASRRLLIIVTVAGALIMLASLAAQVLIPQFVQFDESTQMGATIGCFVGIGVGIVVAAVGIIRFSMVNLDFIRVRDQLK